MSDPISNPEAEPAAAPKPKASAEKVIAMAAAKADEAAVDLHAAADAAMDQFATSHQQAMETLEVASATMFEGVARVQRRIAEFVSDRIRQDMEAQQELLRCKSFEEVRDVQTRFFRTAVTQYSEEATRLFRMGGDVIARSVERAN